MFDRRMRSKTLLRASHAHALLIYVHVRVLSSAKKTNNILPGMLTWRGSYSPVALQNLVACCAYMHLLLTRSGGNPLHRGAPIVSQNP